MPYSNFKCYWSAWHHFHLLIIKTDSWKHTTEVLFGIFPQITFMTENLFLKTTRTLAECKTERILFQIVLLRICTSVPAAAQKELLTSGQVCSILVLHQTPSSKGEKGGQSIYKTTQNKQTHFRHQRTSQQLQPSCCPDLLQASSVRLLAKSISLVSEAQWREYQVY